MQEDPAPVAISLDDLNGPDPEPVEGSGVEGDGHGDFGVRFDISTSSTQASSTNSGGRQGEDPEPVEGPEAGDDGRGNLGVRFDRLNTAQAQRTEGWKSLRVNLQSPLAFLSDFRY